MNAQNEIKIFEDKKVRSLWVGDNEKWYFSIVDVIAILTESVDPNAYWRKLKQRLKAEGNETVTNCHGVKMLAQDGKIPTVFDSSNNVIAANYLTLGFTDPTANDFSLTADAVAAIDLGTYAGNSNTGFSLTPLYMYDWFTSALLPRTLMGAAIDIGAYEFESPSSITLHPIAADLVIYPNPTYGMFQFAYSDQTFAKNCALDIYNSNGDLIHHIAAFNSNAHVDISNQPKGIYFIMLQNGQSKSSTTILLH